MIPIPPTGYLIAGAGALGLLLGASGAWWVQAYRVEGAQALADAQTAIAVEKDQDAKRWKADSESKDLAIKSLNDQIASLAKDAQETQQAALELIDQANERADMTEQKLTDLRRKANAAAPADKPKPLDTLSRDAVSFGLCRTRAATAGTDPASCRNQAGL